MNKFLEKYAYLPIEDEKAELAKFEASVSGYKTEENLKALFSFMDLTSLASNDTDQTIIALCKKVNSFPKEFGDMPLPASICVYPNFASVLKRELADKNLHITTVSAAFPTSQSFLPVKLLETRMAVEQGADEIDIVLALNKFEAEDYDAAYHEIAEVRKLMNDLEKELNKKLCLKVILETGLLVSEEKIATASLLAMEAGADFIKTSTGKVPVNATPLSALIMCRCIKLFMQKTSKKVGFKAAGGISSAEDALMYFAIVDKVLGKEFLNKDLFRLGVSRLANNLLSTLKNKEVKFF